MSQHFTKTMISILKNGIPSDDLPKNLAPSGYVQNVEDWMSHIHASDGNPSKEKFRQMCDFLSQHIGANFAPENIENIDGYELDEKLEAYNAQSTQSKKTETIFRVVI
jgi:hypothetical protein